MKMTIEELLEVQETMEHFVGREIQHVKSGGYYRVAGLHFLESDMKLVFSYETLQRKPVSFVRPIEELVDGRFKIFP